MSLLCISIDSIGPDNSGSEVGVNCAWSSANPVNSATAAGNHYFTMSVATLALLNSAVISQCAAESANAGITIGLLDHVVVNGVLATV